jgi:hypothetical protein
MAEGYDRMIDDRRVEIRGTEGIASIADSGSTGFVVEIEM